MTARLLILTACIVAAAACLRAGSTQDRVPSRRPLAEMPLVLDEWRATREQNFDAATIAVLHADDYVARTYIRSDASAADLFVGYYETQGQGDMIHSPMNCLPAAGWQLLNIGRESVRVSPTRSIVLNRDTIQKGLDTRLVLYWYQSHGRAIASEYENRAYLVLDSLRLHRSDAALVRVIAPIRADALAADRTAVDFVRALYPVVTTHLPM